MIAENEQVLVAQRATGIPGPHTFAVARTPIPKAAPGGVLVRVLYAAVDPAMRGWLSSERNYMTVETGAVMRSHGVGEIVESNDSNWRVGETVFGWFGWQRFAAVTRDDILWGVDLEIAPAATWLGPLGINGLAAWIGLRHFAQARQGETALVSTAAGGVGAVVGQLGRRIGMNMVGLTGSAKKVEQAQSLFGYDRALDYKASMNLEAEIADVVGPGGASIFFDNTAGAIADAAFASLAIGARVVQCGTASVASWLPPPQGPRRERDVLVKRLRWQGFVVTDHQDLYPQALAELSSLYRDGGLLSVEHVIEGLEQAPDALTILYSGRNTGRLVIKV